MSGSRPTGWEGADRWFATDAGGDGEPPSGEAAPAPPPACAVCGAELEPDQTYCLECGSPTPLAPGLRRGGRTAALLAGGMIVLGLGAGALAFAVANDDEGAAGAATLTTSSTVPLVPTGTLPTTPPPTAPTTGSLPADTSFTTLTTPGLTTPTDPGLTSGTLPSTTGFDTVTGPTSVPPTAPASTSAPTTASIPTTTEEADGSSDWPIGATAWTAVLASTRSERDARSAKGRVAAGGDPAGVLFSSDFSDLRPGYWVVFSGRYGSRETAIAQAVKLRPGFPTAYARRIEG